MSQSLIFVLIIVGIAVGYYVAPSSATTGSTSGATVRGQKSSWKCSSSTQPAMSANISSMPYNSVVLAATTGPVGSAVPTAILTLFSAPVGCY